jgi:signal transduction histidine kinase
MNAAALRFDDRLGRGGRVLGYLLVSVPIAVVGVLAVAVVLVGAVLSVAAIGLPLLVGGTAVCAALVRLDRRVANRFLDAHIPPLPPAPRATGGPWRKSLDLLSDRALWRLQASLALRAPLTILTLALALVPIVLLALLVELAVQGIGGLGGVDYVGPWSLGIGLGIVLALLALPTAVLAIAALDALFTIMCTVTRALLFPRVVTSGPVREMLAESLGDQSVSVAYWLPDSGRFVDEGGQPVVLPPPGSGRAWTAVDRDGQRVAAIIHDAALDTGPELVDAAASASSMAIDNERLKADLRARLEELRVSRLRIVEAADAARRRLERDLHDGAQQQLVGLSLQLRLLRARIGDPALLDEIDTISDQLSVAMAELRELARGIHPTILTERGLGPAVQALCERSTVPTDCEVAIDERLTDQVEATAYFVVAEALTNTAKYAHATTARVEIRRHGAELVVDVTDDGRGGAALDAGTGLRGLGDRLSAIDGTLTVTSPPGEGTHLQARLPWAPREVAP